MNNNLLSRDNDSVFFDLVDRVHQSRACPGIEQLNETDWLIEWWFCQFRDAIHVAILLHMVDDFMHELDLPLVQGLIIDKGRERFHGSLMIQPRNPTDQKAKGRIAILSFIVFFASQLTCQNPLQLAIIAIITNKFMICLL